VSQALPVDEGEAEVSGVNDLAARLFTIGLAAGVGAYLGAQRGVALSGLLACVGAVVAASLYEEIER